jgi:glycosyltransferase involved in cell wall biosynthesis
MMLRAFRDFNKTCPGYTLEIYGKGAIEGSLKQMAKDMQIDSMVTFCGFCSDVHARIRDASAYLSSSDYEGLSNSMIEAMGLGLPVICTDCPIGGAKMVIQDGVNGILVPVNDHQAMASAMLRLIKEPSLGERMSDNAVKIKEMLNLKNVIDKWEEIL